MTLAVHTNQTIRLELRVLNQSTKYEFNRIVGRITYDLRIDERRSVEVQAGALSALTTNETISARYTVRLGRISA